MTRLWIYLFLLFGVFRGFVFPGDISVSQIGEWGTGYYVDVFAHGNYAYCAAYKAGLDIVDIADPANPLLRGGAAQQPGCVPRGDIPRPTILVEQGRC